MAKEYIERDSLVGRFLEKQFNGTSSKIDIAEAIRIVNSAPTADVVEVVRCKDCGSYNKHYSECTLNGAHLGENGFCSQGKRKES